MLPQFRGESPKAELTAPVRILELDEEASKPDSNRMTEQEHIVNDASKTVKKTRYNSSELIGSISFFDR